jgi:hypothetical protein
VEVLMKKTALIAYALLMITASGCAKEEIVKDSFSYGDIKGVSQMQGESLSLKKIFFGHQSVGGNIIDGMKDVISENPQVRLSIVESSKAENLEPGVFEHFKIGMNDQPESKIEDFDKIIRNGIGNRADIAFFKLCYIDINKSTDVEKLFDKYFKTMAQLKKDYPGTVFVHVTTPLIVMPEKNIKYRIKKIIGKETGNGHNIARNNYNELMRKAYEGKEPLFDLARLESICPGGQVSCFVDNGKPIQALCPAYTEDGGHLNETGRKFIAGQMLVFLAGISQEKK